MSHSRKDKMTLIDVDVRRSLYFYVRNSCLILLQLKLHVLSHRPSEKPWAPDRNQAHDPLNAGQTLSSKHQAMKTQSTRPRFKHRNLALPPEFQRYNHWPIHNILYRSVRSIVWVPFRRLRVGVCMVFKVFLTMERWTQLKQEEITTATTWKSLYHFRLRRSYFGFSLFHFLLY